ncbi:trimethyltridecatetraene synthase [Lactuca sativa]|nr:trimethyltridecatetraene synthase [Lactuca sativa]
MESLSWILLATAIFVLIFKLLNYPHGSTKNLPPGPRPWPLIGNLNLIGPLPHHSLHNLSQTYGKLMYLKFGSFPVVIASSPDMAKLFLKTHDHIFASRPLTAAGKYTSYNYQDILFAPSTDHWKQGRKIYLNEVFSPKRLDSSEYIRVQETHDFLSCLHALSGDPIILKEHVLRTILCQISRTVLGRKYFSESKDKKESLTLEEFQEMLDEFSVLNAVFNLGDWIPWMGFMDLQGYVKRMKALSKRFDRLYEHVFNEHRARMKDEKEGFVARDVVDVLLKLAEDPNLEVKLNIDAVKGLTQDLIVGATDTTTTTIEWAMSELIKQPHLIKKATEELDRVIGKERWLQETDFTNLPFIDLILKETMRLHPPGVLLAPHLALEDCKVDRYDIVKGTIVFVNTWSIGRDSVVWDDVDSFRPERFLGSDIDVKGQHFELLPFSSGRRMCPGYRLGLKMMRSLLGNMLHGFNWKLPENMRCDDIKMEEVYGLSTKRKFPLVAVLEPRLPSHMYHSPSGTTI